jgi:hypothetical protein
MKHDKHIIPQTSKYPNAAGCIAYHVVNPKAAKLTNGNAMISLNANVPYAILEGRGKYPYNDTFLV